MVIASDIGPVAVVHNPGPDGRYDAGSSIDTLPTDLPELVDELMEEVDDLSEEFAGAQATCKTLEEENKCLRQALLHGPGPYLKELLASVRAPGGVV